MPINMMYFMVGLGCGIALWILSHFRFINALETYRSRIRKLHDRIIEHTKTANYVVSEYQRGILNGMMFSMSIVDENEMFKYIDENGLPKQISRPRGKRIQAP